jgi:ferrous iron transport protein B
MNRDRKIDNYITSRVFGLPLMLLTLALVLWITISGANVPSAILANFLFGFEDNLTALLQSLNAPEWFHGVFVLGLYRTMLG